MGRIQSRPESEQPVDAVLGSLKMGGIDEFGLFGLTEDSLCWFLSLLGQFLGEKGRRGC
jgi:hypothetical protein